MTKTRPPAIEVFTHRNYLLFMVGLGPSAISSWMQRVGVGWLAWELTHSPAWLGMIAAADLIPFLFLSPVAGVLIDRSSPHKILLASQWLQFVHAAALAVTMFHQWLDIELLFALTVFTGVVSAFGTSARHAVVPNTVPKALVGVAVSLDSALFQASRFIGPAIAALVIPIWGVFGAFAAHTFGSFVFSLVMQQMRMATPVRDKRSRNFIADIRESIDYIRHHDGVQPLFIMLATASICLRPMQDMLPGFAQSVFDSDAVGLALLTSAMGVGAMLSATRVALLRSFSGLHKMVFVGLALGGGMSSSRISKATMGPCTSSASSTRGCSSPKWPMTVFGPNCSVPERPGWNQDGAPATSCMPATGTPSVERSDMTSALASKASTSAARADQ